MTYPYIFDTLSSATGKMLDDNFNYANAYVDTNINVAIKFVNNIAALRALLKTGSPSAFALGYYTKGDGGGGEFYYDNLDTTSADNGGTIIVANDGGRWKLLVGNYISVKQFGASSTSTATANLAAIQAAIDAIVAIGGGNVLIPKNFNLTINGYILLPRSVNLLGDGANVSSITGTGTCGIYVKGAGAAWVHTISGLSFNNVAIVYGITNTDYGNGCVLSNCEISYVDTAVQYIYNSWLTTINSCSIHDCTTGVKFSLGIAGVNAGAACRITNSQIFNCTVGVDIIGSTTDGHNILISDTDIEHCDYSVQSSSGDGSINCVNCHFELNNIAYFNISGSDNVFLVNCWMFPNPASGFIANFILSGGQIHVLSGRVQWTAHKLVKNTGGLLFFDVYGTAASSLPFWPNASPVVAGSTGGITNRSGMTVFTEDSGGAIIFTPPKTVFALQPYDTTTYEITFVVAVTAVSTSNIIRLTLNPGGTPYISFILPNTVGDLFVTITTNYQKAQMKVLYSGGIVLYDYASQVNAISVLKYMDISNVGDATMSIYNTVVKTL